jgi:hypothetical protein
MTHAESQHYTRSTSESQTTFQRATSTVLQNCLAWDRSFPVCTRGYRASFQKLNYLHIFRGNQDHLDV